MEEQLTWIVELELDTYQSIDCVGMCDNVGVC